MRWCSGLVHWDDPAEWDGKGGGRGFRMGDTCIPVADSCATAAKSLQSCPTLCDPMDSSPPGFPVPGILQARILEWVDRKSVV